MSLLMSHHQIPNGTGIFPPRTWLSSQPVGTQEWECGFKREKGQTAKKQRIWEKKSESKENEVIAMSKALCFLGGISKDSPAIQGKHTSEASGKSYTSGCQPGRDKQNLTLGS